MEILSQKIVRSGQVKRYGDTVFSVEITTTPGTADDAWEACQKIKPARHRKDGAMHDGACGFPFGLESFGSITAIGKNQWVYTVTSPYCD